MNIAESRKIAKAMLAPYQMLKHIEEVLATAEVAEQSIHELQKQITSLQNDVAQKTIERDSHIAECKTTMELQTQHVTVHANKCQEEIKEARENARRELEKVAAQSASAVMQHRATHNATKKVLTDEIARLTKEVNERTQAVEALEARRKSVQDALEELRAKVI